MHFAALSGNLFGINFLVQSGVPVDAVNSYVTHTHAHAHAHAKRLNSCDIVHTKLLMVATTRRGQA
jgi:hypothetical protein